MLRGNDNTRAKRRNRYSAPPGPSFSVYAPFRKGRIALARHFASLTEAMAFCERVAADRFEHAAPLTIIDDHTGADVTATRPAERLAKLAVAAGAGDATPRDRDPFVQALAASNTLARDQHLVEARQAARAKLDDMSARLADFDATLERARARVLPLTPWVATTARLPGRLGEIAERCRRTTAANLAQQQELREQLAESARRVRLTWETFSLRPWDRRSA